MALVTISGLILDINSIKAIKLIRRVGKLLGYSNAGTMLGLKESKDLVDGLKNGTIHEVQIPCTPDQEELLIELLVDVFVIGPHLPIAPRIRNLAEVHQGFIERRHPSLVPGTDQWCDEQRRLDEQREDDIPF